MKPQSNIQIDPLGITQSSDLTQLEKKRKKMKGIHNWKQSSRISITVRSNIDRSYICPLKFWYANRSLIIDSGTQIEDSLFSKP
jgi:hypothetical protein